MNFKLTLKLYRLLKTVIWLIYSFYALIALMMLNKFELKLSVLICGILIQLTLIKFIDHWYKFKQPLLLDWFRLTTFFSVVLNFMFLVYTLDQNVTILIYNVARVGSNYAFLGITTILTGIIGLNLGELVILKIPNKKIKERASKKIKVLQLVNIKFLYLLSILIGFVQIYLIINGITGYGVHTEHTTASYSFLLQTVKILYPFILGIFALYKFYYHYKIFNLFFWSFFILQIAAGFLSGMKEEVFVPIVLVLIPFILGGNKLSKQLVGLSIIFILILYPINNNYRNTMINNPELDKATSLNLALYKTFEEGLIFNLVSGTESYQDRLSLFPTLMYSVSIEKDWTYYKYLNRYVYMPVAWFVPRFLLPGKPISDIGAKLYEKVTSRDTSAITPSTFGWAYLEGGFLFVFISLLLFGLFVTQFEKKLDRRSTFGLLLFMVTLILLLKAEFDIYFKIIAILQVIFIGYLFRLFFLKYKVIYEKDSYNIQETYQRL
jgi:hypothetical protein